MYFDAKRCEECGSEVELRARTRPSPARPDEPAGPSDGVVGGADQTVDERVCTNPECPTHRTN